MILVVLGLAIAVGAEAGPKTAKPTTPKPTIAKTQAPKGGAPKGGTVKGSASKGSTVKVTGAQPKGSTFKAKGAQAKVSTGKAKSSPTVVNSKSTKSTKSDTKFAKADTKGPKAEAKSSKAEGTTKKATNSATSSGTPTSTSTAPIDFTATALGQKLQKNSAIRSKIEAKLLAAGYTGSIYEAAYGFKNLGQLNAATNQVQNQGYSFNVLKVLMTGTYVDPQTHVVYRANQLPDGTVNLVRAGLATNPASTKSLGQAKQAIAGGAEMPSIDRTQASVSPTTSGTSPTSTVSVSGTVSTNSTTASKSKRQPKSR
jgi:hypothetical protein